MTQLDKAKVILARHRLKKFRDAFVDEIDGENFRAIKDHLANGPKRKDKVKALKQFYHHMCNLDDKLYNNILDVIRILED